MAKDKDETTPNFHFPDALGGFDAKVHVWGDLVVLPDDATEGQILEAQQHVMLTTLVAMGLQCLRITVQPLPNGQVQYTAAIKGTPVQLQEPGPGEVQPLTYRELAQAFLDQQDWLKSNSEIYGDNKQEE